MSQITIAVQIVNYKTKQFLEPLIKSIVIDIAQSDFQVEINIIDNASGDDLSDIDNAYEQQRVRAYASDHNGDFGAGHNMLASKTRADYLLLLNPDTLLIQKQTIGHMLKTLQSHQATIVGPRLLTPKNRNNKVLETIAYSDLQQQLWDHGQDSIWRYRRTATIAEVMWVSGAVLLIERQAFIDSGGFDEKFFLHYEEVDLCRQIRKKGGLIIYDPSIEVMHYGSAVAKKVGRHLVLSFIRYQLKSLQR